jgi:hypothetical protein
VNGRNLRYSTVVNAPASQKIPCTYLRCIAVMTSLCTLGDTPGIPTLKVSFGPNITPTKEFAQNIFYQDLT